MLLPTKKTPLLIICLYEIVTLGYNRLNGKPRINTIHKNR